MTGASAGGRRRSVAPAVLLAAGVVLATLVGATAERRGVAWLASASGDASPGDASLGHTSPAPTRASIDPALDRTSASQQAVIVQARPGMVAEARRAIVAAGGDVDRELPLVDGVEADVPGTALDGLARSGAVRSISADGQIEFEEYTYDETTVASSFARTSGATAAWAAGRLGRGVGVAVIDTGVSPMPDFAGRLVHGPDLSGEGTVVDTYGHGTVMAGLVGGSGADSAGRSGGSYTGVAPGATLVSVKVAGRNGAVDVSTMLEAMHWVAAHREQYGIRVLNLSWGTASTQSPSVDPLNYAVQRLWRSGIVVVVAAGNGGPTAGSITKPGDDPVVLTVGAYDDKQDVNPLNDIVPAWSSRGPTAAGVHKPDVVAPGRTVVGARSYGSTVEAENPRALLDPSYIKGSGSSQAAAVVSGLAALLLEANPALTPDQVKALLTGTASPIVGVRGEIQGSGRVRADLALAGVPGLPVSQLAAATGLGSIEASRGGRHVEAECVLGEPRTLIRGEIDVWCQPWDALAWTASSWTTEAWMAGPWEASAWEVAAWSDGAWTGGRWTGRAWTGRAWTGRAWTTDEWSGRAWTGRAWTGASWTGVGWSSTDWTTGAWTTATYDDDEFLTSWWGDRPKPGRQVPGELNEDEVVTGAEVGVVASSVATPTGGVGIGGSAMPAPGGLAGRGAGR